MIKLEGKIVKSAAHPEGEIVYPPRVKRMTTAVYQKRPIVVELCVSGIQVGLFGTQQHYLVPYDQLFVDAQRGSVSIAPRAGAVTQKTAAALINRDMEAALRFYANTENWKEHETGIGMYPSDADQDGGEKAREALARVTQ
jgi:hypothetical protein